MKKKILLLCFAFPFILQKTFSQDKPPIILSFPEEPGWNVLDEGQKLEFDLKATGGTDQHYTYSITQGMLDGMSFDSLGHFSWTPGFDFVDRLTTNKTIQLIFQVKNEKKESASKNIGFKITHVNRPPAVGELKPFYVQYDVINKYKIDPSSIKDLDNDPLVFIAIQEAMPEGATLSEQGEFTWKPSHTQFNHLRSKPLTIEFYAEDQPAKIRTKATLKVEPTQLDLPPLISIIPNTSSIRYEENATVNLKFYLSDPNGDSDIITFDFISENPHVPNTALVKNTSTQYEFIWIPGYNFVKDPFDSLSFKITFYLIDKSQKRNEKVINMTILNAINEEEKDHKLYLEYRNTLVRAWDLLEQLKETEKKLKRDYNRAKKGKKHRSITNASLGAVTGIVPVVNDIPTNTKKAVSAVGGTTVLTIGTLEATEVIGKSTKDLIERLNYVMEKKNEVQTKGDVFARKYALKSSRRKPEFIPDMDNFLAVMSLKGLVALELNAGWENKAKANDSNLSKTFKDFIPEESL